MNPGDKVLPGDLVYTIIQHVPAWKYNPETGIRGDENKWGLYLDKNSLVMLLFTEDNSDYFYSLTSEGMLWLRKDCVSNTLTLR